MKGFDYFSTSHKSNIKTFENFLREFASFEAKVVSETYIRGGGGGFNCFKFKCVYIFYILLYIFKTTAFNHPALFYIPYSSRLITFNITNLEFK